MLLTVKSATEGERHRIHRSIAAAHAAGRKMAAFLTNDDVILSTTLAGPPLPSVIAIPGGLPVKVGEDVIGGAGVSGSPGVDEPCVQDGLDKVADQLK